MPVLRQFSLSIILLALYVVDAPPSPAQTFMTLATFDGKNGRDPFGPLVQGTDGNFYGTAGRGGATCNGYQEGGCGTVFKVTPTGTLTTLHKFCSRPGCPDGAGPSGSLVQGTDGNFYGTTGGGGSGASGTFFRITAKGKLTTLYNFCSQPNCADGDGPGALVQGTDGSFYGTTAFGALTCPQISGNGCGTIFKVTDKGKLDTLYTFCSQPNCADGAVPLWRLVQGTDGNFYGTTQYGGAAAGGTVFRITPAGAFTALYSFCSKPNCSDGFGASSLTQGSDGNFYGTTQENGSDGGPGTVFRITPEGALTTLYTFCSQPNCADGDDPVGGLLQATDGNFYGTASDDGYSGTVFRITPGGALTTLYTFCSQPNCTDGSYPLDNPVQGTDGTFYGLTTFGGVYSCDPNDSGCGTAFSLSVGLGPFIATRPTSGNIGTKVIILGNDLEGTTSVAFNGTEAVFKVVSSSEITTKVPKGASTGPVQVVTPGGTLTSNVNFQVN